MSDIIDAIRNRVSSPRLGHPAPTPEHLETLLDCALRAPDHGRLQPWHFTVVQGDGLQRLGEVFVAAKSQDDVNLNDRAREKLLNMPQRAPMVIVVAAKVKPHPKVPPIDQQLAVGAAVQNMQLAARALGYGVMWRTGELTLHPYVKQALGLQPEHDIIAFLYLGTALDQARPPAAQDKAHCVNYWD